MNTTNDQLAVLMEQMIAEIKAHRAESIKVEHIQAVWGDERTWDAALNALSKKMNAKTDAALGGWFRSGIRKVSIFFAFGMIVYALGGWGAIAALAKALLHATHSGST